MLAGSTHDSKRSEDVRARLSVLSEMADEWRRTLSRWSKLNRSKRRKLDTARAPCRNDEYLLYRRCSGSGRSRRRTPKVWRSFQNGLRST